MRIASVIPHCVLNLAHEKLRKPRDAHVFPMHGNQQREAAGEDCKFERVLS